MSKLSENISALDYASKHKIISIVDNHQQDALVGGKSAVAIKIDLLTQEVKDMIDAVISERLVYINSKVVAL